MPILPAPPGPAMQAALRAVVQENIAKLKAIGEIQPNRLVTDYEHFLEVSDVSSRDTGPQGTNVDVLA